MSNKNGFPGVVLGLSGGIDSALCAAMAVDALGPERVHCVMLPYRYTSNESLADAAECAQGAGRALRHRADRRAGRGLSARRWPSCSPGASPTSPRRTSRARVRGSILMAISNKFGRMVLTTGNKSEMSVGYATLYGDMNGGFNPIKDLYKMEVYRAFALAQRARAQGCQGPGRRGHPREHHHQGRRPPSCARTRTTRIRLPPYEVLDDILKCLVEKEMPLAEIVAHGHPAETVKKVERLLYLAEYKRRQAAPGVKISQRNFGRDRRYPITNKFREDVGATDAKAPERATPQGEPARMMRPRADGGDAP